MVSVLKCFLICISFCHVSLSVEQNEFSKPQFSSPLDIAVQCYSVLGFVSSLSFDSSYLLTILNCSCKYKHSLCNKIFSDWLTHVSFLETISVTFLTFSESG